MLSNGLLIIYSLYLPIQILIYGLNIHEQLQLVGTPKKCAFKKVY